MKIVVIGGTGLIGSPLVKMLQERGHDAVAASPSKGVNAVTGEGLAAALAGADMVVDVANSPSFDDEPVMKFFEASTRNLLAAGAEAGVKHYVALSVVGAERLLASGYFRAKMKQEKLIEAGPLSYTIVRATQFYEFVASISYSGGNGQVVNLPTALIQPIAAGDVSAALPERRPAATIGTESLRGRLLRRRDVHADVRQYEWRRRRGRAGDVQFGTGKHPSRVARVRVRPTWAKDSRELNFRKYSRLAQGRKLVLGEAC